MGSRCRNRNCCRRNCPRYDSRERREDFAQPSGDGQLGRNHNGEDLATRPDEENVQSAIQDVPNVYYPGTAGVAPIIRGQDTQGPNTGAVAFYSGTVPRASINIDGHYQTYFETVFGATSIWDVDQIEVFRGPQTTSQGANSIAGAIIVKTKDPTFTPEGALQAEYGSYNTHRVSGMLSGPLSSQLAARVALDYYGRDTFIDYINSSFTDDETNLDIMSFNGRAKLLYTPDAIPGLTAKLTYATAQNNQPTYEAATVQPYDRLETARQTCRASIPVHTPGSPTFPMSSKTELSSATSPNTPIWK